MWTSIKRTCGVAMMVGAMSLAGATAANASAFSFAGGEVQGPLSSVAPSFDVGTFAAGQPGRNEANAFLGGFDINDVDLQVYSSTNGGKVTSKGVNEGLQLSETKRIRFTYFGKDANLNNLALIVNGGTTTLFDQNSEVGDVVVLEIAPVNGLLPFVYRSGKGADANNAGTIDDGLWMAFARIPAAGGENLDKSNAPFFTNPFGKASTIAFFGDGGSKDDIGTSDYNDMVVGIGVVPVPPAVVFLLTAIAGLGLVRSRRSKVNA